MGQAALATRRGGPPLPPEGFEPRDEVSEYTALPEPPDLVLVLDDPRDLATAWPDWGRVVAVVVEGEATGDALAAAPCVVGVAGIGRSVRDGDLVLVDADRGVVTIDPDMRAVAEFQEARSGARARFVLGHAHLPVATLDGVPVRVAARVGELADVDAAMRSGADALVVLWRSQPPADGETRIQRLAKLCAGKPITVLQAGGAISSTSLVRAAAAVDLTVALSAEGGPAVFDAWREEAGKARESLLMEAALGGEPRLAAWVEPGGSADVAALGVSRVIVRCGASGLQSAGEAAWFDDLAVSAASAMVAVEMELADVSAAAVSAAIGLGAAALIVPAGQAGAAKDIVRGLRADDCREEVRRAMAEAEEAGE